MPREWKVRFEINSEGLEYDHKSIDQRLTMDTAGLAAPQMRPVQAQ